MASKGAQGCACRGIAVQVRWKDKRLRQVSDGVRAALPVQCKRSPQKERSACCQDEQHLTGQKPGSFTSRFLPRQGLPSSLTPWGQSNQDLEELLNLISDLEFKTNNPSQSAAMTELNNVAQLSFSGSHRECLKACQDLLQVNPEDLTALKFSGRSFIALGQFQEAQQLSLIHI